MALLQETKIRLSEKDVKGFVSLLEDSSEQVLNLIAQQIPKFDDSSLKYIEEIVDDCDNEILLDNWNHASKLALTQQIQTWKKAPELETGLFLLARLKNPGLEIDRYQAILENLARRVSQRIKITSNSRERIQALNQVMFGEEGFVGNQLNYYDLENNFLHTVIDTRMGNPIMLSALYILVGRRAGLDLRGIGAPGHFIVKYEDLLLDPFFAGKSITKAECIIRSQELDVNWRDEFLDPIDDALIVSRSIRNLASVYKKQKEFKKAADITSLLKLV